MRLHLQAGEALEAVHARDLDAAARRAGAPLLRGRPGGRRGQGRRLRAPRRRSRRRPARLRGSGAPLRDGAHADRRATGRAAGCCSLSATPRPGRATRPLPSAPSVRPRNWRETSGSPSCSPAPRSATAAGSCGRSRETTSICCRCSSGRSTRSATRTAHARQAARAPGRRPASRLRFSARDAERRGEALAMARRLGDPATLAWALAGYIPANHSPTFTRPAGRARDRADRDRDRVGDRERAHRGPRVRFDASLELGEVARREGRLTPRWPSWRRELRQPSQDWYRRRRTAP